MAVRNEEMGKIIFAVSKTEAPVYYKPEGLANSMYRKNLRIIGGVFNEYERQLLSIKGMRKKRLIIELQGLITAAVEVEPEFIQIF